MLENIALATLVIPFIGALLVSVLPTRLAPWLSTLVALLASLGTAALGWLYLDGGKVATTLELIQTGDVALFGFTVDGVSTLIAFAVVFLGFLICLYSTGYLTEGNREHAHGPTRRYYAFLLIFIGAMAGVVLSSTILGQLVFFEITGGCSWALIGYYQTEKSQRSAMKALLITHVGSLGLYMAAATLFISTGTFALSAIDRLSESQSLPHGVNQRSYHCKPGFPMRWKPQPQLVLTYMRPPW